MGFDIQKFLLEDDAKLTIQDLNQAMKHLMDRMELLEVITAPKSEDRMFRNPYQKALINPGQQGEVYRQDVPPGFVGVITRVGNTWFPNTHYVRIIDGVSPEPKIERSIAAVDSPAPTKVFTRKQVLWQAQNDDGVPHTFEVLTDGFFIPISIADRIRSVEG